MRLKAALPGAALLLAASLWALPAHADSLDGFDQSASQPKTKEKKSTTSSSDSTDTTDSSGDDNCDTIGNCIFDFLVIKPVGFLVENLIVDPLGDAASYATSVTFARVDKNGSYNDEPVDHRYRGDALLPEFRLDLGDQRIGDHAHAADYALETGYGPFALDARQTFMRQSQPQQSLTVSEYDLMLRVSSERQLEVNLGLGATVLDGLTHSSGPNLKLGVQLQPRPWLGLEASDVLSDVNGNTVSDEDASLALKHGHTALRLGFRHQHTHDSGLQGPYLGLSLYY